MTQTNTTQSKILKSKIDRIQRDHKESMKTIDNKLAEMKTLILNHSNMQLLSYHNQQLANQAITNMITLNNHCVAPSQNPPPRSANHDSPSSGDQTQSTSCPPIHTSSDRLPACPIVQANPQYNANHQHKLLKWNDIQGQNYKERV